MHHFIKKIYYRNKLINRLGKPLLYLYRWFYRLLPLRILYKIQFKRVHRYRLNLDNPKTINEKIQWIKLNVRDSLYTKCIDKYAVRELIAKTVGANHLIPLIQTIESPDEFSIDQLPDFPVILKATHDSGSNLIIRDKKTVDERQVRKLISKWVKRNYYTISREWLYKNIPPKVVIEKLLMDDSFKIPNDIKFHCFHGEVKIIFVVSDREGDTARSLFDKNWNPIPAIWASQKMRKAGTDRTRTLMRPKKLSDMIRIAEKLAKPFPYVRVDLYCVNNQIYFGELTFMHGGGFYILTPFSWDEKFGSYLNLDAYKTK